MRQRIVLDFDRAHRVPRVLFGVGGDGSDRIALIHDLRAGLFPLEGGLAARRFFGGRQIDRYDPRMRMRRSQNLAVEHAGPVDVVRVSGAAGHFIRAVEPLDRRAENSGLLGPQVLIRYALGRRLLLATAAAALRVLVITHEPPPSPSSSLP